VQVIFWLKLTLDNLNFVMYEENILSPKQKILKQSQKGAEAVICLCK
jgi:hypothetical protein